MPQKLDLISIKHTVNNELVKQAVTYLRYSDPGQGEGYTIENQREYCNKAATLRGYEVTREFRDEGISGGTDAFSKRKGLLDLLSFCKRNDHRVSAVIIYKIDRLSRSNFIYAKVKKELADQGIRVLSATEETPDSPTGDAMQGVFAIFAEWDNAMRSMRASDGMRKRIENGLPATSPPTGYLPNGKSRPVKDATSFDLIKQAWHIIEAGGQTIESVAQSLRDKGLPIKTKALYKILRNPFYCGFIRSSLVDKDMPGIHEPMISPPTFYRVQQILDGKNPKRLRQVIREEFPLRGLVLCKCGRPFTGTFCQGKRKRYPYYICLNRDVKYVPTKKMHTDFVELLDRIQPKKSLAEFYVEHLKERWQDRYAMLNAKKSQAKAELAEIETKKQNLLEMRLGGEIDSQAYLAHKKKLELEALAYASEKEESKLDKLDVDSAVAFLKSFLSNISKFWLEANVVQKRAMQCLIFSKKLTYTPVSYRTPQLSEGFRAILPSNSTRVTSRGIGPRLTG